MEKNILFTISDVVLILRKYDDLEMHGKFGKLITLHILDIVENNKVKYQLSTQEGYSVDTIMNFLYAFSNAKAKVGY